MNQPARTTWPDPAKPGFPLNPERDGVHALLLNGQSGPPEIGKWIADSREWLLPGASLPKSAGWASNLCRYLSPLFNGQDMRAAYEKGVHDGYNAAEDRIAESEQRAAQAVEEKHRDALQEAHRAGAAAMRQLAARAAEASEASMIAQQLRSFDQDDKGGGAWHRRMRVDAILALPLPSERRVAEQLPLVQQSIAMPVTETFPLASHDPAADDADQHVVEPSAIHPLDSSEAIQNPHQDLSIDDTDACVIGPDDIQAQEDGAVEESLEEHDQDTTIVVIENTLSRADEFVSDDDTAPEAKIADVDPADQQAQQAAMIARQLAEATAESLGSARSLQAGADLPKRLHEARIASIDLAVAPLAATQLQSAAFIESIEFTEHLVD